MEPCRSAAAAGGVLRLVEARQRAGGVAARRPRPQQRAQPRGTALLGTPLSRHSSVETQAATGRSAPALTDSDGEEEPLASTSGRGGPGDEPPRSGGAPLAALKRLIRPLASLKLAIAELAVIAGLSTVGTVIEQGKPYAFYAANYPEQGPKVLGFIDAPLIWALQWDHIYSADYFLALLAALGASLAACTWTTQWPAVQVAQRWRFLPDRAAFARLPLAAELPNARLQDLGALLAAKQYQVFLKNGALYAFKGLAGKLGPIGVHASLLAIMAGVALGAVGSYHGTMMVPEGGDQLVAEVLTPASPMARLPSGAAAVVHVDDFRIDYRSDGSVRQFFTDVTVRDLEGRALASRTMLVNRPLRFGGVTAYQTDWSMAALTLRADGSPLAPGGGGAFNLPMASLAGGDGKLYATFLPAAEAGPQDTRPRGVSILARDLQAVTFYDSKGEFVGVRRPGSGKPIRVEGLDVVVEGIVASSGMELKYDPGVPLVYAGFGGLCVTTVVSYLSHSQVWALQAGAGASLLVGGRTNRAKFEFERELGDLLAAVPEAAPSSAVADDAGGVVQQPPQQER